MSFITGNSGLMIQLKKITVNLKMNIQNQDIPADEAEEAAQEQVNVQKAFAESYITDYLKPRFDESRSMNEFVEYLDVRQEEQNPFQTQSLLNAVNEVGQLQADAYLDQDQRNCSRQKIQQ